MTKADQIQKILGKDFLPYHRETKPECEIKTTHDFVSQKGLLNNFITKELSQLYNWFCFALADGKIIVSVF